MKIPETSANVGAYYGNEENGQWQPNGVIIDGGVGGGIVGSGDAGVHRPGVYPVHIPRGHMPAGYVMAGAYYPPAAYAAVPAPVPDDFADYMWMENEEEFDKQVMQQLEEEALMEQCIEAMLEDEQRERNNRPHVANGHNHYPTTSSNGGPSISLEETVSKSTLNPLAAEFVPTRVIQAPPMENKQEPQSTETIEEVKQKTKEEENVVTVAEEKNDKSTEVKTETIEEIKTEEQLTPPKDPPEVSAADVHPIVDKQKESKKDTRPRVEAKKNLNTSPKVVKVEPKKKPAAVKSEPKITQKKKEVKAVKSESRVEEKSEEVVSIIEAPKSPQTEEPTQTPPTLTSTASSAQNLESPTQEQSPETTPDLGPKPVNYAAAARANKPKKPSAATVEKTVQPVQKKLPDKKKTEKPTVQRKNSAK